MKAKRHTLNETPSLLDVVALPADLPAQGLARGQVGTVVEQFDSRTVLVEFSDDQRALMPSRLVRPMTCWC
jgi:hypothetical protein